MAWCAGPPGHSRRVMTFKPWHGMRCPPTRRAWTHRQISQSVQIFDVEVLLTQNERARNNAAPTHRIPEMPSARSRRQRKAPAHRVKNGPANGEGQDGWRSRGRSYLVSGARRRNLMPPCGSPLMTTTNSVSLPACDLNAWPEMTREDRGDAIGAIRSNASC